ncbi:MAG: AIR synthase family protein [Candidatus Odinarchaeum yellowstonii]|uniref:AIR synthase family protein n=1 Tax=Odinarchaeota yellowstonii (strain LCB_4) TaxID=1841599 RepID=A0AAF0D308_ODILC|nr:MAG: AIR synthase family protein [Candidatus Odinarchaeum yellowstonii]
MLKRPAGKISIEEFKKYVLPFSGCKDDTVLLGPGIGEDAAIVKVGGQLLVLKTDPISGAVNLVGWLAVHINANDVATRGGDPKWFLSTLILPTHSNIETVRDIMKQINEASIELGVSIVGGHTEFTNSVDHPIVVGTMIGSIKNKKYFSLGNVKERDLIVETKAAGIEATSIIATDFERDVEAAYGRNFVLKAKDYIKNISIVKEARVAANNPGVSAMHDCTEGGVITAVYEIGEASDKGLIIWEDKIPIWEETSKISELFNLNPLEIISSGSLLITVDEGSSNKLLQELQRNGVPATVIGKIMPKEFGRKIKYRNGVIKEIEIPISDALWKIADKTLKNKAGYL